MLQKHSPVTIVEAGFLAAHLTSDVTIQRRERLDCVRVADRLVVYSLRRADLLHVRRDLQISNSLRILMRRLSIGHEDILE
jgi:hypothetical protein